MTDIVADQMWTSAEHQHNRQCFFEKRYMVEEQVRMGLAEIQQTSQDGNTLGREEEVGGEKELLKLGIVERYP